MKLESDFIPVKNINTEDEFLPKNPEWIKVKFPTSLSRVKKIKEIIRKNNLHSVCEEASCPNLPECFNRGVVTFMILGNICTRRCPFCNVKNGRPLLPDKDEPKRLSKLIAKMKLNYVVITSVNRDDLHDGGAKHFLECIRSIRKRNPKIKIEILVPDFRNCMDHALDIINISPPDIFNHNIESIPRLYKKVRPGADYNLSLRLLKQFKKKNPKIPTKSGIMLGFDETISEIIQVMKDLFFHGVKIITIGQYLQPSPYHLPVYRYVTKNEFNKIKEKALEIGFSDVICGPLVRSSYYADQYFKVT